MVKLNETHDPNRRSLVAAANDPDTDFPIQNLPFGVFRRGHAAARGGVAIGDRIFDLAEGVKAGLFSGDAAEAARAASGPTLNPLFALGARHASALRAQLSELLRARAPERQRVEALADRLLVPMSGAILELPCRIGAFTDFLCSIFHAGRMISGLPESFKYLPIAYNSRASSVVVSGTPVRRPNGEFRPSGGEVRFGPEPSQDFELELGAFIAAGNPLGTPLPIDGAAREIFGFCLVNDWSARGIQSWETRPLGPFLGKSLATTISPWVVTAEALAPFRCAAFKRADGDPKPLPHLYAKTDQEEGGIDLAMEAYILTPRMRERGVAPSRVTATNFKHMYWTFAQMVAHHMSNGCNLQPGDLLASGTCSGPSDDSRACLAELSARGSADIHLANGEVRRYLADGDEVIFRARAAREGHIAIGFGECRGRIEPAVPWPER
ncbi:MAG TPA: fumarylacetoacetase [Stellaceae bacterium]|nr:fumarylacetoacetase [Stellaceae bacterium]